MKPVFLKSFIALFALLIVHHISKAQNKKDSLKIYPPLRVVKKLPKTNEDDNRSVYKLDSSNSKMPVLSLSNNSRMPVAKLNPVLVRRKLLLQDSLKKKFPY